MMSTETAIVGSSVVSKGHRTLADRFVERVISQLGRPYQIKKYGVDCDWRETESIDLEFDCGTRMVLSVIRKTGE
jgi:hypothetical protein